MADNASGTLELSDDIKRAIRSMKHSHPEIGFKKLLTELRIDWPGTPKVLVKEYLDSGMQMPAPVPPPPGKQHKKQQTQWAPFRASRDISASQKTLMHFGRPATTGL